MWWSFYRGSVVLVLWAMVPFLFLGQWIFTLSLNFSACLSIIYQHLSHPEQTNHYNIWIALAPLLMITAKGRNQITYRGWSIFIGPTRNSSSLGQLRPRPAEMLGHLCWIYTVPALWAWEVTLGLQLPDLAKETFVNLINTWSRGNSHLLIIYLPGTYLSPNLITTATWWSEYCYSQFRTWETSAY